MNKIAFNIFLIFSGFLVIVVGLAVTMMLAPGADILGVRYIRSTSGSYYESESIYCGSSGIDEFIVTCDNIPTTIKFVQSNNFTVEMNEMFNGYTKTVENPDIAVDNNGNIVNFIVREYVPFVYHNRLQGSGLTVCIPIYYTGKVAVTSNKSNIVVDGLNGTLSELTITTNGKVDVSDVAISNLNLSVGSKDVNIASGAKITNLGIVANNADIAIVDEIYEKITYKADGGSLRFKSCKELNVEATGASIGRSGEEIATVLRNATIKMNGDLELEVKGDSIIDNKNGDVVLGVEDVNYYGQTTITTSGGNIQLNGSIYGDAVLTTKRGDITANKLSLVEIKTMYGQIEIDSCKEGKITAGSSDVIVKSCDGTIAVSTRSGNVLLGNIDATFNGNAEISTLGGDVSITNANGSSCNVSTSSGDVSFLGSQANNTSLNIKSKKGYVNAENITGKTRIETAGEINLLVSSAKSGITIVGKNKDVNIQVPDDATLNCNTAVNGKIVVFEETIKEKNYKTDENADILVTTNKGKITVLNKFVK